MKPHALSLFAAAFLASSLPAAAQTVLGSKPEIMRTAYGEFDAHGQPLNSNEAALKRLNPETVQQAAERGDAEAQFQLAKMYTFGIHMETDHDKAFLWYAKAAGQKHPAALNNLAVYHGKGVGTKADPDKARQLVAEAAALEQPHALVNQALDNLERKEPDAAKALAQLEEVGKKGFVPAYFQLYHLHAHGIHGVAADPLKAQDYLLRAADGGYLPAQTELTDVFLMTMMSPVKSKRILPAAQAYAWGKRACANGSDQGCAVEKMLAAYKTQDLRPYQKQCQAGNQTACENHNINKALQDELLKIDRR